MKNLNDEELIEGPDDWIAEHKLFEAMLNEQAVVIREAALREAADACDIWPADEWHMHTKSGYIFAAEECQRNILDLIGEKK